MKTAADLFYHRKSIDQAERRAAERGEGPSFKKSCHESNLI